MSYVSSPAIGHELEKTRAFTSANRIDRLFRYRPDRREVVAIRASPSNAVRFRITTDRRVGLPQRDVKVTREEVVLADEQHRCFQDRGEIHGLVKRAFFRRAITEERNGHSAVTIHLRC